MYENVTKIEHLGKPVYMDKNGKSVKPILKDISKPFSWNNLDWNNILYIDTLTALVIACLVLSAWGYVNDTRVCADLLEHPCTYAASKQCPGCVRPAATDEFVPGNDSLMGYEELLNYTIPEIRWAE